VLAAVARERWLVVATLGTIVGWTVYGLVTDAPATFAYLITVVLLAVIVAFVHGRVGFSRPVLWILWAWLFAHMAGGLVPWGDGVLYNAGTGEVVRYDKIVHAIGFGTATVACWQALRATNPSLRVSPGVVALVALMGMGVGALNEVVEFFASTLFASNVGGYVNTGWDLVANMVGCIVAATLFVRSRSATRVQA
jgi:putative membrane protein